MKSSNSGVALILDFSVAGGSDRRMGGPVEARWGGYPLEWAGLKSRTTRLGAGGRLRYLIAGWKLCYRYYRGYVTV